MSDDILRQHLVDLLTGHNAHLTFEQAFHNLAPEVRGKRPEGASHTPWQLLEHLRIATWDILEFSRKKDHLSPKWPDGYWPESESPADDRAWEESMEAFRRDIEAMCELIRSPASDLYAEIPWGKGQTILREALLLADHNAYHVGQIVTLRRLLGDWPPPAQEE